jgi:probable phosphoglycerate mutase
MGHNVVRGNLMTTILYLIRHGETDWNASGRWQGHTDVPLNDKGLRQAQLLAQHLHEHRVAFHAIYSSDLTRAYQTAWEIGSALRIAVQLWPPLREIDMGAWSGLTREEIRKRYPDDYALLEHGHDIRRGGGETAARLYRRVVDTVQAMISHHPNETIALVTHGGPIRSLVGYVAETYGADVPDRMHIGNTSVTIVECLSYMWQVTTYNDMQHLYANAEVSELVSAPPDDAEQPDSDEM